MPRFGFKTVFSKLFASVMMTLVGFAVAMIALTHLVHDHSASNNWQAIATKIVDQIDPFVDELDNATTMQDRLQARFMLAVIKKSFDIFDESLEAKMGLYDRDGNLLIQTDESDLPKTLPEDPLWIERMIPFLSDPMPNVQAMGDRGYSVLYEPRDPPKQSPWATILNLFTGTVFLLMLMTILLWWIAHSMTWRLNEMSQQMLKLGEGDFSVRVPVSGTDEVAQLARGFNQSAQKIEQLINANSLLLAHASHELRTPITRIRLQTEMMQMLADHLPIDAQAKFAKRVDAVNRDLTGLNDLVESILLVSRLDAGHALERLETFDLFELTHQECQHYPEAALFGEPLLMQGQPKLVVHLVRNLLNNAMIHGTPPIVVQVYGVMLLEEAVNPPEDLPRVKSAREVEAEVTPFADDSVNKDLVNERKSTLKNSTRERQTGKKLSFKTVMGYLNSQKVSANQKDDTSFETTDDTKSTKTVKTSRFNQGLQLPKSAILATLKRLQNDKSSPIITEKDAPLVDKDRQQSTVKSITPTSDKTPADDKTSDISNKPEVTAKPLDRMRPLAKVMAKDKSKDKVKDKSQPISKPVPNYAVLAVIDQGAGVPLDKRQEIFSPFVRLKQEKKGSGLGLSLVAQIIEAHGGEIRTDTWQGKTRFLAVLPVQAEVKIG